MRKNVHSSGRCPALAGSLPGMQGETSAGGNAQPQMPEMRQDFYVPLKYQAMAEILPGLSVKTDSMTQGQR